MSKSIPTIVISSLLVIGIAWLISEENLNKKDIVPETQVVTEINGIQQINMIARGGYSPSEITAQANKKSELLITTKGTYDCSSALHIPKLNYRKNLPASGTTTIEIPADQAQGSMEILCSMGMYSATINFI